MKLMLGLTALMLSIGAFGFWVWRSAPEPPPCTVKLSQASFSQDGKVLAEAFEQRCETSLTTHVTLRKAGAPEPARSEVFIAAGAVPVSLSWVSDALQIQTAAHALAQESSWHGTKVYVKP